jgi:hypothetical protein
MDKKTCSIVLRFHGYYILGQPEQDTVATQSFRTAERSLWENGYFENSPKIEFSSEENDFWTGGS